MDQARLDWLRTVAGRCRAMAGDDLFRACAMLGADGAKQAADSYAIALFRSLPGALGGARLRLYQPGATDRSFDESWLLAALAAGARGDDASLTFLLASRLPPPSRRQTGYLIANLSRLLDIAA
jgi:hypothetical protein